MFELRPVACHDRCFPASRSRCGCECPRPTPPSSVCDGSLLAFLLRGTEYSGNRARKFIPLARLDDQLSPPLGRKPVELGATIVFRRALFGGNPAPLD